MVLFLSSCAHDCYFESRKDMYENQLMLCQKNTENCAKAFEDVLTQLFQCNLRCPNL